MKPWCHAGVPPGAGRIGELNRVHPWGATGAGSVMLAWRARGIRDANYLSSVLLAMGASSTPLASLTAALDGRLQRFMLRQFRHA